MSVILGHIGHFGHLCRIDRVEIVLVAEYGRGADVVGVYAFVGLFVRGGAYVQRPVLARVFFLGDHPAAGVVVAHRFQSELYHAFFLDAPAEQLLVPFDFGVSDLDLFQSDTCAYPVQVFERCGLVALGLFVAGLGVVEIDFRQAEGRINRLHRSVILGFAQRLLVSSKRRHT